MPQPIHSILYPFAIDRSFGVLQEEHDYDRHVEQLIIQVLFTNPGERINRPDFGCGLRRMVFTPNSAVTASLIQVMVFQSLEKWLGSHISVEEVKVSAIDEKLEVGIIYILKVRRDRRYLNINVNL